MIETAIVAAVLCQLPAPTVDLPEPTNDVVVAGHTVRAGAGQQKAATTTTYFVRRGYRWYRVRRSALGSTRRVRQFTPPRRVLFRGRACST